MKLFCKRYKVGLFYWAYFFIGFLYIFLLRVPSIPSGLTYFLYVISIATLLLGLTRDGIKRVSNRTDVILALLFFFYYFISGICYVGFSVSTDASWLVKDYLYSLLPLLFYVVVRLSYFQINEQLILFFTLLIIILSDIIAIIMFVFPGSFISRIIEQVSDDGYIYALSGVFGVIVTGFLNVIGLSICLLSPIRIKVVFKILFSILFIICIFLAGQRTPFGGLAMVLLIASYRLKGKGIVGALVLIISLYFVFTRLDIEVDNISVKEIMTERYIGRIEQIKGGDSNRGDQYVNEERGVFSYVFGSGVGKHSPENPDSKVAMPDAMLNRIFNEMGIIGLLLFIFFFLELLLVAIKRRDSFMIAFIAYVFFANMFNRVLFIAPTSILPYVLIARFNWCSSSNK